MLFAPHHNQHVISRDKTFIDDSIVSTNYREVIIEVVFYMASHKFA